MAAQPRLGPEDWLRAGLVALATSGPEALKAESLARALGTTKGSFYWHFENIDAFKSALSEFWLGRAETALKEASETEATAAERLRNLSQSIGSTADEARTEAAFRAWAQFFGSAAEALSRIDAARIVHIRAVLDALGLTNPEFARIVYGAHIGMLTLPGGDGANESARSTLTAALLALQEG
ncbi:TetR/AcrR family transcriptional regulator [Maritimibacter sp. HL-12]|uniref:TetR/AcrR family transcriptional regulator n=1 Tax=Maritimibacter sp. HL-12 TaxID=1162418 RepID=UPI000A0F3FD8|nr:TetR/AcrR family transcriptional regulator [Maritimibacter sp. HL-12]SMH48141.1 transcriptional regulator, TetR family [Maritimibacter sp. HL-12]